MARIAGTFGKWPHEFLDLDPATQAIDTACAKALAAERARMVDRSKLVVPVISLGSV